MHDDVTINATIRLPNGETLMVRKIVSLHEWVDSAPDDKLELMRETAKGLYLILRLHEKQETK